MNILGSKDIPFVFIIDFEMEKIIVASMDQLDESISMQFPNFNISKRQSVAHKEMAWLKKPIDLDRYQAGFNLVKNEIQKGNTYLANLTYPTQILSSSSLSDIYDSVIAKYKILVEKEFVVFSPETFVKISEGFIHTYPMKGTIDANKPNALHSILNDEKEIAEHYTIVDLLRNDLSKVANKVQVVKFRYPDFIETNHKKLIQISSEIRGTLPENFHCIIGDIIFHLLPAGSVSGAPKNKTVQIIKQAEGCNRGYYTGVAGYFDGSTLDSAVMIRFLEDQNNTLIYRSGGGITSQSELSKEYQEMIDKVYLPNTITKKNVVPNKAIHT